MDYRPLNPRLARDDGASTAMLLTVLAGLTVVLAAALTLVQIQIAAARAAGAADLAALSAADAARGIMFGEPCALADQTVQAHGGTLLECTIADRAVAHVVVQVDTPVGVPVSAESRAGPKQPAPGLPPHSPTP